eukprot:scaffold108736_cov60-Phaeocystis_antarctica.AAC.3
MPSYRRCCTPRLSPTWRRPTLRSGPPRSYSSPQPRPQPQPQPQPQPHPHPHSQPHPNQARRAPAAAAARAHRRRTRGGRWQAALYLLWLCLLWLYYYGCSHYGCNYGRWARPSGACFSTTSRRPTCVTCPPSRAAWTASPTTSRACAGGSSPCSSSRWSEGGRVEPRAVKMLRLGGGW